jgi:MFS family permease
MFLPQVVTAITAALLGSTLARRITTKRVFLLGLAANIAAMVVLITTAAVESDPLAYPLLLLATAFLGLGFGLTVPVLNIYVAAFRPDAADGAVLVLNALLGLGTALAPVFVAVFVGLGFWWGLPVLSAVLLAGLLATSLRLPLHAGAEPGERAERTGVPRRFWAFAAFALLYGVCETMNGNWSQLELTNLGASVTQASLGLTAFWAMVTVGRLLFASVEHWMPPYVTYHFLPLVLVCTFALTAVLPQDTPWFGIAVFGLAGLGCSALLPLTISFGDAALPTMSAAVAGGVIAFYQVGYGIAAFGVGRLVDTGTELSRIYGLTAFMAAAMAVLSQVLAHGPPRRGGMPRSVERSSSSTSNP